MTCGAPASSFVSGLEAARAPAGVARRPLSGHLSSRGQGGCAVVHVCNSHGCRLSKVAVVSLSATCALSLPRLARPSLHLRVHQRHVGPLGATVACKYLGARDLRLAVTCSPEVHSPPRVYTTAGASARCDIRQSNELFTKPSSVRALAGRVYHGSMESRAEAGTSPPWQTWPLPCASKHNYDGDTLVELWRRQQLSRAAPLAGYSTRCEKCELRCDSTRRAEALEIIASRLNSMAGGIVLPESAKRTACVQAGVHGAWAGRVDL